METLLHEQNISWLKYHVVLQIVNRNSVPKILSSEKLTTVLQDMTLSYLQNTVLNHS